MHGLHRGEILRDHRLHGAAALLHIAQRPAQNAHIGIGFHKNLNVQQLAQPGIVENQDTLHNDHLGGPDLQRFLRAVMQGIGVDGAVNGFAPLELFQILDHQIGVKGVGMVIILLAALFKRQVLPFIVIIMMHHTDLCTEMGRKVLGQCGFAASGAACDADKNRVHSCAPS